jgi:hypothetical protein
VPAYVETRYRTSVAHDGQLPGLPEQLMNMGGIIMTVRAHGARSAMNRMIRPAPDGRRRAKDPGPAARHDEQRRRRSRGRVRHLLGQCPATRRPSWTIAPPKPPWPPLQGSDRGVAALGEAAALAGLLGAESSSLVKTSTSFSLTSGGAQPGHRVRKLLFRSQSAEELL